MLLLPIPSATTHKFPTPISLPCFYVIILRTVIYNWMEKAEQAFQINGNKTCKAVLDKVLGDVEKFTGGQEQSDDIAVLLIGRNA